MNNKEQAFVGGAAVHKELQGFAAFLAYQSCHQDGGSITKAMIEASMGVKYFGDPNNMDSIGLAEQLVTGVGIFSSLYESRDTFGMDPRLVTQPSLIMKPILHCLGSHVVIPVGGPQGISLPLLFQSKLSNGKKSKKNIASQTSQDQQQDDRIKARTLLTRAQEITKNCKKALACVMSKHSPYKDYARTGNLPSGMVHDDYLQYVRERMYVMLNPDETTAAAVDNGVNTAYPNGDGIGLVLCNTDTDASTTNVVDTIERTGLLTSTANGRTTINGNSEVQHAMPASSVSPPAKLFTFPGYIVFALVGPIVENDSMLCYRSDLLMSSAPVYSTLVEKRTAGRAHRRKLDAEASRNQKHHRSSSNSYDVDDDESSRHTRTTTGTLDPDNSPPPMPAATLSECIQAAGIAQSRLADKGKKKAKVNDRIVAMHLKKVAGKQSMIQETKYLIDATAQNDPNRQVLLLELRKLNNELAAAIDELTSAEEQIIEHEVADASTVENIDTMIDATIASILTNVSKNSSDKEQRVVLDTRMMSPSSRESNIE